MYTREIYSPHGTTGKRSSVSLLLHSCTDFGERAAASSEAILPLCAKQSYVGMGFQTAESSQWSCKELGEESGLLASYWSELFSLSRNVKMDVLLLVLTHHMQLVQWLKLLREGGSVPEEQHTHLSIQLLEVLQSSTTALDSLLVSHFIWIRIR